MITPRPVQNYLADCIARQLPPEKQPAARQALAELAVNPLLVEAALLQIEESATAAAKTAAAGQSQAIAELNKSLLTLEKRLSDKPADAVTPQALRVELAGLGAMVESGRDELRRLEDKVDTLAPYQLWKVYVIAGAALMLGAVVSWNIQPIYKRWQWEQSHREGR